MHATQESFSKILNPLTDNIQELRRITSKTPSQSNTEPEEAIVGSSEAKVSEPEVRKARKKPEPGFENFLR